MGQTKKKKINKLARMSEEERLRYLQHRAVMEEEALRRKQEIIATYENTKLQHEQAFSRINSAKINQYWRCILRQIKCKELKENGETLEKRFKVALHCKNEVIEDLLTDFNNAEFQYSLQFDVHTDLISKFTEVHWTTVEDLREQYMQRLQDIKKEYDIYETEKLGNTQNEIESLQTIRELSQQQHYRKMHDQRENFDNKINELRNQLLYKIVKLEETYANQMEEIRQKTRVTLLEYKRNTDTKMAHYKILTEKDDLYSTTIINNFDEIFKYVRRIELMKKGLKESEEKRQAEIQQLTTQKSDLLKETQQQRLHIANANKNNKQQLKELVGISSTIIKELSMLTKKGNQILQIYRGLSERNHETCKQIEKDEEYEKDMVPSFYKKMQRFWKYNSGIELENRELIKRKKAFVFQENQQLKKLFRFYMASISSPEPQKFSHIQPQLPQFDYIQ